MIKPCSLRSKCLSVLIIADEERTAHQLVQILLVTWLFLCPGGLFCIQAMRHQRSSCFSGESPVWTPSDFNSGTSLFSSEMKEQNYKVRVCVKPSLILNMLLVSMCLPDIDKRLNITVEMLLFF